ncbi:MAG: DNA polymerase III subunit delta' [Chloroflexia bacterium]
MARWEAVGRPEGPASDTVPVLEHPVIGHRWAVDLLTRQLRQGCIGHAYLFTGPPGVGRGTLARWLAQALLCLNAPQVPCGTCPACARVANGTHPDLRLLSLETQGGRRTLGIDAVRELRATMAERPFAGTRKVYLIEDAETMTPEAANALLKTLEEPPPFAVLLLVALSDHLLLPTIVSRCQHLPLRPLGREEVRRALVARWGATEEQAEFLAALSRGRLGWAVRALQDEAVLARREEELGTVERLLEVGLLDRFAFAEAQERRWKRGEQEAVLDLLEQWEGWWRDLFLAGQGCEELVVNRDRLEQLRAFSRRLAAGTVLSFLQALRAARQRLQEQVNPRLVLEDLLLRLPVVV